MTLFKEENERYYKAHFFTCCKQANNFPKVKTPAYSFAGTYHTRRWIYVGSLRFQRKWREIFWRELGNKLKCHIFSECDKNEHWWRLHVIFVPWIKGFIGNISLLRNKRFNAVKVSLLCQIVVFNFLKSRVAERPMSIRPPSFLLPFSKELMHFPIMFQLMFYWFDFPLNHSVNVFSKSFESRL